MDLLRVQGLNKKYTKFTLHDVSFSLPQGRIMGIIGKNGAGKSTILKSILNMVCPDNGSIEILGKPFIEHEEACKKEIGIVLGGVDFYSYKKVSQITAVTKRFYPNWDETKYQIYLKMFDIDSSKRINQLSAGMKVKYAIALALSHHAKLLILDEPTSGLDPVSRDDILELFKEIVADGTRSILFSTHITSDLEKCADDICYIHDGTVLACAEKHTFMHSFQHLKQPDESFVLSLEEIMIRTERRSYHV